MLELLQDMDIVNTSSSWQMQVFIVIFLTLVLHFVCKRILRKLAAKAEKTHNIWDEAFVEAMYKPVRLLILLLGTVLALEIFHRASELEILLSIYPLRDVAVISIISWFVIGFIKRVQSSIIDSHKGDERKYDPTTIDAIGKILRVSVIITAALIILQTLGFSVAGVMAFGGVGGMAVGFAARDLLANFFGALMIYMDKPFVVGNWVRSPDKNIEGIVEDIGWRQTRIRAFDKRPLYVPNSLFSTIVVQNPSRMTHRRIYEHIGVRYDDAASLDAITKDVKKMLLEHDAIDNTQTLIVNVNKFSESSIDFFVYTFTKTTKWVEYHEIKHEILLAINNIIMSHGAEIAFPTSTLHVVDPIKIEGEAA